MMDYRIVRLFSSSSFSCRRKNSDLVRQRSSMRDFFFFFFASNVNTHRLRQNYRAFYEPFYELNIFSSLVCGAVKEVDRNNIVHGYVYTRISFFFYSSLLSFFSRNTKNTTQGTQRKKGNDLSIYSSIVFFSFFLIFTEVDRESFDLEQQGCCFAQPVLPSLEMEIRVTRKYFPASRPGPRSVANKIKQSRLRVTF